MKYLVRSLSIALAAGLQLLPLCRVAASTSALSSGALAAIFRWVAGAGMALGATHAVSGASTTINSPTTAKGTNGIPFLYRITTAPDAANQFQASPLPSGLVVGATTGRISGVPLETGTWSVLLWASDNFNPSRTVTQIMTLNIVPGGPTAPIIVTQPKSLSVNQGTTASLSVEAVGTAPINYQWQRSSTNLPGATATNLVFPSISPLDAGNYRVILSNSIGSVTSSVVSVAVKVPPTITVAPVPQLVPAGKSASFSVQATGTSFLSYTWFHDGQTVVGGTLSTLTIPSVSAATAGQYTVRVLNSVGSVTSAPVALTLLLPPVITANPAPLSVLVGDTAVFSVAATSQVAPGYQWYFSGAPIQDATNSTLTLPGVTTANAGDYHAVVSNDAGTVTSTDARLTVQEVINTPLVLTAPAVDATGLSLKATGPVNSDFVLWTSADLLSWEPIQTNRVIDGVFQFTGLALPEGIRFYRATASR